MPRILVVDDNPELLSLLGRLIAGEGWEPVLVNRGRAAIDAMAAAPPDAAVVDVLLPDMMGYEVGACCKNAGVPFVFVTGVFKGPRAAEEAKAQHGAAGYFEKPFEARELLAALAALLPGAAPAPGPEDAGPAHPPAAEDFEVEVAVDDEGEPARRPAAAPSPEPTAAPPPEGALHDNLPDLLAAFYLAQQTGELTVQRGPVRKTVFFERGLPRFAISNLRSDRLGPFLVRAGKLTEEQLREASAAVDATRRRMGEVLVERGLLGPEERAYYVGQQVKAIIYTLFGWEDGAYRFHFTAARASEEIKLSIHPAALVLRGVKRLYRRERLARLLPDGERLAPSVAPVFPPAEVPLAIWEKRLLGRVDGVRTVAELAAESGKPLDEARAALYALVAARILDRA